MEIEVDDIEENDGNIYQGIGKPSDCFDHLLEQVEIIDLNTGDVVFSGDPSLPEAQHFPTVIATLREELENPTLIEA